MWPFKRRPSTKQRSGLETKSTSLIRLQTATAQSQPPIVSEQSLKVRETEAIEELAKGVNTIASFLAGGGFGSALSLYARSNAIQAILGGLASHDGRNALDARTMGQNALEIVEQIEKVYDKLQERLETKSKRDPDIQDSEADFKKWQKARVEVKE